MSVGVGAACDVLAFSELEWTPDGSKREGLRNDEGKGSHGDRGATALGWRGDLARTPVEEKCEFTRKWPRSVVLTRALV